MNLRRHLWLALILGFSFRLLSLHYVWGPQALDDYLDNLIPAWKVLNGLDPDMHSYRSPLYMWILELWLKIGSWFGIQNSVPQIQWVYFFQTLSSLLAIPGVFIIAHVGASFRNNLTTDSYRENIVDNANNGDRVAVFSMYLVALHGLMPFASTRSFMESFVMGPITLGIAILYREYLKNKQSFDSAGVKSLFIGFGLLGLSVLVRFQVGVIYVAWFFAMCFLKNKKQIQIGFIVGILLILAESAIDMAFGRLPFETLYSYVKFTAHTENAPIMPWYNTSLTMLGFLYFPFSFLLWSGWLRALKEDKMILISIFSFILFHSISLHKEERYLYPILPLALIYLAKAWVYDFSKFRTKYVFNILYGTFNVLVLFVGCFVNTQTGLVLPVAEAQMRSNHFLYINFDEPGHRDNIADFFMRESSKMIRYHQGLRLEEMMIDDDFKEILVSSSNSVNVEEFNKFYSDLSIRLKCGEKKQANSLSDRIMIAISPDKNSRRNNTDYFICTKN